MKTVFEKFGVAWVWHFTDESNIDSIKENGGLLSRDLLERRGIKVNYPGSDHLSRNLDVHKCLNYYVHLAFVEDFPMFYHAKKRMPKPVWLKIDYAAVLRPDVRYCEKSSNYGPMNEKPNLLYADEAKDKIDFEAIFSKQEPKKIEELKRELKAASFSKEKIDKKIAGERSKFLVEAKKAEILIPDKVPVEFIFIK